MTKTHEAIIVHNNTADVMQDLKIACAQVKAKLNIKDFVHPIDWIKRPYGNIVVVEVPSELHEVGKSPKLETREKREK